MLVQKQRGLRKAYQEGMPLVRGDLVITFSPDGNSKASELPALVAKLREGIRYGDRCHVIWVRLKARMTTS